MIIELFIIGCVICFVSVGLLHWLRDECAILALILNSIGICLIIAGTYNPPTTIEYLRGNVEVTYEKVYQDSILIRTDTIIEFKKIKSIF